MESVIYSFLVNKQMATLGVKECGLYTISRKRQIIITLICLGVIVNSIYSFIRMRGVDVPSVFCLVASVFLIFYVDLSPSWYIKKQIENWCKKGEVTVSLKRDEILVKENGEEKLIRADLYKGFRRTRNFFIIYHGSDYVFLPTHDKTDEELIATRDILETYQTYGKTDKKYEDNFIKKPEEVKERDEEK